MKKFLIIFLCVVTGIAMWKVPFGATVLEYETITYDANPTVDLNGLEKNIKKTLAGEDCRAVIIKGCG